MLWRARLRGCRSSQAAGADVMPSGARHLGRRGRYWRLWSASPSRFLVAFAPSNDAGDLAPARDAGDLAPARRAGLALECGDLVPAGQDADLQVVILALARL